MNIVTLLEEYSSEGKYLGSRVVEACDLKPGPENGRMETLQAPLTLYKGSVERRPVTISAKTRVRRWLTALNS